MELDSENPHAALFQARLAAMQVKPQSAQHWLLQAQHWARERGEENLLREAAEFTKQQSSASASSTKVESPVQWVRKGVALLKRRQLSEALEVLERTVALLDMKEHGGPIELNASRATHALAFDALEALGEVHAARGVWQDAMGCGQRSSAHMATGSLRVPEAWGRLVGRGSRAPQSRSLARREGVGAIKQDSGGPGDGSG